MVKKAIQSNTADIKFSVLVPVYNVEKYLVNCVESVLNQTYQNFEIILVDDGSTDKSGKICDKLAKEHNCIKTFHKSNAGQLHTRTVAIEKATGDWYIFLDSDDTLQPNALQFIYEKIIGYDCDCVMYRWQRVFDNVPIEKSTFPDKDDVVIIDKREMLIKVLNNTYYNSLCLKACSATLFDGRDYSNFYNVKHAEDLLQSLEILENSKKMVITDAVLYNYTFNPNSISNNFKPQNLEHIFTPIEEVFKFVERLNVLNQDDIKNLYNNRLKVFVEQIMTVCFWDIKLREKVQALKSVKTHPYYKRLFMVSKQNIFKKGKYLFLFNMYKENLYKTFVLLNDGYRKLYNLIKR